jgi:pyruvate ferredoxin oxidoreductase alpha subunit
VFQDVATEFLELTGRRYDLVEEYRLGDARTAIVALGSSAGTVKDVVDELRDEGNAVGLLEIRSFRPFPAVRVAHALNHVGRVVVLDRADSPGGAPPLYAEVAAATYGHAAHLSGSVYGLGGRDLHPEDVRRLFSGRTPAYVGVRGEPCRV